MVLVNDTVYQLQWFVQLVPFFNGSSDLISLIETIFTIRACRNRPYTVYISMVLANDTVYQLQWSVRPNGPIGAIFYGSSDLISLIDTIFTIRALRIVISMKQTTL
jgi:hypothetical protein